MRVLDQVLIEQLSGELESICDDMLRLEASLLKRTLAVHEARRPSARNLAHYLALRRHDVRGLQSQLALLGLSSLGRTESHALTAVQTVHHVLNVLVGKDASVPCPAEP
jgi:pyruvate kinase